MNISETTAWKNLEEHAKSMRGFHLRDAFCNDRQRFDRYNVQLKGLLYDYSKQRITDTTLRHLFALAKTSDLEAWRERLFTGERINHTENRAVLHTALRDMSDKPVMVDGRDVKKDIQAVIDKMEHFVDRIHKKQWKGYTGKPIDTIINIGIGGSDLGPKMLYDALRPFHFPGIKVRFVSSLDGFDLAAHLSQINPETTLFCIASKTFTTQETMQNAHSARKWFLRYAHDPRYVARHFVAISTNAEGVREFGIDTDNMFEFWDWVGGRYSLWSAVGLTLALGCGMAQFNILREGAYAVDKHFRSTPMEKNIPVLMALIGIWNRNFLKAESLAVLPYDHSLKLLPEFLQQLGMESNGKSVDRHGNSIDYATGAIVWGSPGNNGQHAFFQLLHQSKTLIPIDFIGSVNSAHAIPGHQQRLFSNMVAQSEALMRGKSSAEVAANTTTIEEEKLIPYRTFDGNVPSNMILMDMVTPYTLGMLIALYEHKVFVQGVIWNLNSFDQWGVELGKELANDIFDDLSIDLSTTTHDSSTQGLMSYFQDHFMDYLEHSEPDTKKGEAA